jgi:hypothetical protein
MATKGTCIKLMTVLLIMFSLNVDIFANPPEAARKTKISSINDVLGVYEYVYEHNTKDLIENHFIVLEREGINVIGRYYGTSDDFDDLREGYLPGFYGAPMKELIIRDQKISFRIDLQNDDLFMHPIPLSVKTSHEIDRNNNPRWIADYQPGIRLARHTVVFSGKITAGEIILSGKDYRRVFKKEVQKQH